MDQASQEIMSATQSIQKELSKLSCQLTKLDVEEDVHWKTAGLLTILFGHDGRNPRNHWQN